MDTTPEYIKMCEKATEIQDKPVPVSVYTADTEIFVDEFGSYYALKDKWSTAFKVIYLPRQDQLQDMTSGVIYGVALIQRIFNWTCKNIMNTEAEFSYSMEQLWLAFVLREKYNKTWDGEDWVTTN
jgi:hypothetical protein